MGKNTLINSQTPQKYAIILESIFFYIFYMNLGKITGQARSGKAGIFGEFHIEFPSTTFWPYNYVFTRENLYFCEELSDRWVCLFPLKEKQFENTEIFLEREDIVICCGVRGSFSGQEKLFVELVNLETQAKHRFFPEEISLIYHTQETLVCCYKNEDIWKKSEFSLTDFSLVSETQEHISAFFKLFYNHTMESYGRLILKSNPQPNIDGYFLEENILSKYWEYFKPQSFIRNNFLLDLNGLDYHKKQIDVWEASLTWEM